MSLSDLAALGSFVSGVAVAITLIMLLVQMRQSDRNQRAAMQQNLAERASDLFERMGESEFASLYLKSVKCPQELDEVETWICYSWFIPLVSSWQSSFLHHKAGLLDKGSISWERNNIQAVLSAPLYRAFWRAARAGYGAEFHEFRDFVDAAIAETPVLQGADFRRYIKPLLDEQIAKAIPQPYFGEDIGAQRGA